MNFSFSDDQLAFRDAVRGVLRDKCTIDDLRGAWTNDTGRIAGLWEALAEQGLTLLSLPEEAGGLGCGELDTILIFEEAGRACVPEPLIEVVAVAVPLLVDAAAEGNTDALRLMNAAAEGTLFIPALDGSGLALYADEADFLIVAHQGRLLAVPQAALTLHAEKSADRTRRLFRFEFDAAQGIELASGETATRLLSKAEDRGALAASAFLLGVGDAMIQLGVDHTTTRKQFNTPIGAFQAVQHRMVNGWMGVEFARPVVYRAAYSMQNEASDASMHVSMAKIFASEGAFKASKEVLQCHGAIGYTTEYELHMLMKRAWALAGTWGDKRSHEVRVEKALLG